MNMFIYVLTLYTYSARFYAVLSTLECAILRRALNPRMRDLTPSAQLSNAGKDATRSAKSIRTPGVK